MREHSPSLVDLLLLVDGELAGAHVDQQEETATAGLLVMSLWNRKEGTYTMDRIWKKSYLAKSLWGWCGCNVHQLLT
jgi:hypothetical protein